MTVKDADLEQVRARVAPLLGQRAWGVRLGVGSFVTIEFGEPRDTAGGHRHGEWHLWVYCCAWRLDDGAEVVAASEDARAVLEDAVRRLDGRVLERVDLTAPAFETVLWFDGRVALRLFPIFTREFEHWLLYLPDGEVLTIGPGRAWSVEADDRGAGGQR